MSAKVSIEVWFSVVATALACHAAVAAEASGDYATDLATVYSGYQRMLATKDACDDALPEARSANSRSFAAWQSRNQALIQDLQRRVDAMIRLASRDEKEYARNLGKYEGAILQERQEYRQLLLGLEANELREHCQRMPDMLKSPEADLSNAYAAELKTVRQRK